MLCCATTHRPLQGTRRVGWGGAGSSPRAGHGARAGPTEHGAWAEPVPIPAAAQSPGSAGRTGPHPGPRAAGLRDAWPLCVCFPCFKMTWLFVCVWGRTTSPGRTALPPSHLDRGGPGLIPRPLPGPGVCRLFPACVGLPPPLEVTYGWTFPPQKLFCYNLFSCGHVSATRNVPL